MKINGREVNPISMKDPEWLTQASYCIAVLYEILMTEDRSHAIPGERIDEIITGMRLGFCHLAIAYDGNGNLVFSPQIVVDEGNKPC